MEDYKRTACSVLLPSWIAGFSRILNEYMQAIGRLYRKEGYRVYKMTVVKRVLKVKLLTS